MTTDRRSRYRQTATVITKDLQNQNVVLRELRVIPQRSVVLSIRPTDLDRLDLLAYQYYRDPTMFWKICDASEHLDPLDVVISDQLLAIPPNK